MVTKNEKEVECLTVPVETAGKMLGISRATAYMLANTGRLPAIRISDRRLVVPVKSLNQLLDSASSKKA